MFSAWDVLQNLKHLTRRTAPDEVLRDKAFNIAKNPNYGGYQRGLASMVNNPFDKKNSWKLFEKQFW